MKLFQSPFRNQILEIWLGLTRHLLLEDTSSFTNFGQLELSKGGVGQHSSQLDFLFLYIWLSAMFLLMYTVMRE